MRTIRKRLTFTDGTQAVVTTERPFRTNIDWLQPVVVSGSLPEGLELPGPMNCDFWKLSWENMPLVAEDETIIEGVLDTFFER